MFWRKKQTQQQVEQSDIEKSLVDAFIKKLTLHPQQFKINHTWNKIDSKTFEEDIGFYLNDTDIIFKPINASYLWVGNCNIKLTLEQENKIFDLTRNIFLRYKNSRLEESISKLKI